MTVTKLFKQFYAEICTSGPVYTTCIDPKSWIHDLQYMTLN